MPDVPTVGYFCVEAIKINTCHVVHLYKAAGTNIPLMQQTQLKLTLTYRNICSPSL